MVKFPSHISKFFFINPFPSDFVPVDFLFCFFQRRGKVKLNKSYFKVYKNGQKILFYIFRRDKETKYASQLLSKLHASVSWTLDFFWAHEIKSRSIQWNISRIMLRYSLSLIKGNERFFYLSLSSLSSQYSYKQHVSAFNEIFILICCFLELFEVKCCRRHKDPF